MVIAKLSGHFQRILKRGISVWSASAWTLAKGGRVARLENKCRKTEPTPVASSWDVCMRPNRISIFHRTPSRGHASHEVLPSAAVQSREGLSGCWLCNRLSGDSSVKSRPKRRFRCGSRQREPFFIWPLSFQHGHYVGEVFTSLPPDRLCQDLADFHFGPSFFGRVVLGS